jgi:DNA-binding response OmpR family regulator
MPYHHQHDPATTPGTPIEPTDTPASILHGRRLSLSATATRLLAFLLERQGQVVSLEALSREAYGCTLENTLTNRLRLHISRIRSIIAPHGLALYPVENQGYLLLAEEPGS